MNPKSEGFEFDEQQMVFDSAWDEVMSNFMKRGAPGTQMENVSGPTQKQNDVYSTISRESGGFRPDGSETTKLFKGTV